MIVVVLPCLDLLAGIGQQGEQRLVEKLIPETPVEALDEAVLHGLVGSDVVPLDARALAPVQHGHRGHFIPNMLRQ